MKKLLLLAVVALLPLAGWAQQDEADQALRTRIAAERAQAEARYKADEKACYGKFAVNDCLNDARKQRRAVLADLRRQEVVLNDVERKRKAAERARSLEERSSAEKQQEEADKRAKALSAQRERDERAAEKAASRASSEVSRPAKTAERQEQVRKKQAEAIDARTRRDEEAAAKVRAHEKRLAEAKERKASLDKRMAERKKATAQPLPVPP